MKTRFLLSFIRGASEHCHQKSAPPCPIPHFAGREDRKAVRGAGGIKACLFILVALICSCASAFADYATDVGTVGEAQAQALEQAKQMLSEVKKPEIHDALKKAIQEMERAESMLADAKSSPEKLTAAVTAEEAAYQSLLKTLSHEFQISQSRGKGRTGGRTGQPRAGNLNNLNWPPTKTVTRTSARPPPRRLRSRKSNCKSLTV